MTQMSTSFTKEKAAVGKSQNPSIPPRQVPTQHHGKLAAPAVLPLAATTVILVAISAADRTIRERNVPPVNRCATSAIGADIIKWCANQKSVREISEYSEDEGFLSMVDGGTKQWFTTLKVDGKPIEYRMATGADVDVI